MMDGEHQAGLLNLLAFYREMGVDCALAPEPVDWLNSGARAPGSDFQQPSDPSGRSPKTADHERGSAPAALPAAAGPPAPAGPVRKFQLPERNTYAARELSPPQTAATPPSRPPAQPPALRQFPTTTPDAAETSARRHARAATSIDDLAAALARFDGCALKATAKNLCFFRGSPKARLMIIGEAPGRDEDLAGKPFVGPAGQLLDKMLAAIQLGENDVHITNIVYWRPPGNRTPTPQEAQVCRPFLDRQIELVEPDMLLLLGGPAAKAILDVPDGIMKLRGTWRTIEASGRQLRVMPTLHPAYLLRTPAAKRQAWKDLLAVKLELTPATTV